jgi:predicted nucleic acid-binding Zn ribbon protein
MPIYEFKAEKRGAKKVVSALLTRDQLDLYNRIAKVIYERDGLKLEGNEGAESSLYKLITEEPDERGDKEEAEEKAGLSWEEFKEAYEELEKNEILYHEKGRLRVLPRKYSSTPVFFTGPGFYSTDSKKGAGSGDAKGNENYGKGDEKRGNGGKE